MVILWFIGLFFFFHGIGYSKHESSLDFKAGYFIIGILIIAPIYYYIHSIIESGKGNVYFDKYIPANYYLDLEFLESWEIQNKSGK
ncbi:hypothetical protein [uncultured Chryseobacterium sp.]|uniref:hypothetical protein n=1 Tax=uncultured Chryseobacterium sp. TaxID=259322 RepID=UPI0025F8712C|nr:hypothetical protein [uncultured Chryseobacterium sp.]